MGQRTTYGHRRFFGLVWQKLLSVGVDGFDYGGRSYVWSDIKRIKRYDSFCWTLFCYNAGAPVTYLFLEDGNRIRILGRFLEGEGEKSRASFLRGATTTYWGLVGFIEKKVASLREGCPTPG
ncbi:MAG: hypothetical protein ACYSU0_10705 [Planctomycetota bacterium]|jgi:hypothetical protein